MNQSYQEFEKKVGEFLKKAESYKLPIGWYFAVLATPQKMLLTKIEGEMPETFIDIEGQRYKLMRKFWNKQKNIELNWYEPVEKKAVKL